MKKIIFLVVALTFAIAYLSYQYFSRLNTENDAKDFALQTATGNAALVFGFQIDKSFINIMEGQSLFQKVLGDEKMAFLDALKSKVMNDPTLRTALSGQTMYLSVLPDSNHTVRLLYTFQINDKDQLERVKKQVGLKQKKEEDVQIALKLNDSCSTFIHLRGSVITACTSSKLLWDVNNNRKSNEFSSYIKNASRLNKNVLAQLFINFNQAPPLLKKFVTSTINGQLSIFNKQNSYAMLNYNFSKERILFNGSTDTEDENNYLKLFTNLPSQQISITNCLPENTANYSLYAFGDYSQWLINLRKLQLNTGQTKQVNKMLAVVKSDYHTDLNKIFNTYVGNQSLNFQLSTSENLAAFVLTNGDKFSQLMLEASDDYSTDIRIFKTRGIINAFFGEPFKNFDRPFFTIIDNYLVVANHASTIQSFLNSYKQNRLIIKTPQYLAALNQLPTNCNVSYYLNLENSKDIFRQQVLAPYYKHLRADSGMRSFDTFYYQMSADKNRFITNLLLNKYTKPETPDSLQMR